MNAQSLLSRDSISSLSILKHFLLSFLLFSFFASYGQVEELARWEAEQRMLQVEAQGGFQNFCGTNLQRENNLPTEDIDIKHRFAQFRGAGTWNLTDGYGSVCVKDCDLTTVDRTPLSCAGSGTDIFRIPIVYTLNTNATCVESVPSQTQLDAQIHMMNDFMVCQNIPMEFYQPQSTRLVNVDCNYDNAGLSNIPNVINVYVFSNTGNGTGCNGFAFLPSNANSPTTAVMSNRCYNSFTYTQGTLDCTAPSLGFGLVLIHEMGHYFGLYHTHDTSTPNGGVCDDPTTTTDNCTNGDLIADTDSDPDFSGGEIGCTGCDTGGAQSNCSFDNSLPNCGAYGTPNTINNVMSYNNFSGCRTTYTECQKAKMIDALLCARGPQMCDRDVDAEFAGGAADTNVEICVGDAAPTFTASDNCYNWYDDLGGTANSLATNSATFTPTVGIGTGELDVNTPGTYTWYLGDLNEVNPDCRTAIMVTVQANPGSGSGNNMATVEVSACGSPEQIALSTDVTALAENGVIGWWVTENNPISTTVTDDASLNSALGTVTMGGTLSNTVNHLFESTTGTPVNEYNLPFDCSTLNEGTTYYATPVVAQSRPFVAATSCANSGAGAPINVNFGTGDLRQGARTGLIDLSAASCPTNQGTPSLQICIDIDNYVNGSGNLGINFRQGVCSNAGFVLSDSKSGATTGAQYCYTQSNFPSYDPITEGMCLLIWDNVTNSSANNVTLDITLSITLLYDEISAIPFPSISSYNDCLFGSAVQINCNCIVCPTTNTVANDDGTVCNGDGTDDLSTWQTAISTANPLDAGQDPDQLGSIVYSSVMPVAGTTAPDNNLPTGNHSGTDNCVSETQSVSAYLYCDTDESGTINTGDTYTLISSYDLTVYPAIQAPTITTNDCVLTVTGACTDVVTLSGQTVANGVITNNTSNSVTYTAQPADDAGMVSIDITSGISGNTCTFTTIMTATPECAANCPTTNIVTNDDGIVCSGDGTDDLSTWQSSISTANPLDGTQDPGSLGSIVYSSVIPTVGGTTPDNNLPTGNHSGVDNCVSETQSVSAYLYCDTDESGTINTGDTYTLISSYDLTVYPAIQAPTITTNDCVLTVTGACTDVVTLSGQTVANGVITNNTSNSVTYTAQPADDAGMVSIDITSSISGSTCTFTTIMTATPACTPLPIELSHFSGQAEPKVNVLKWTTATENNTRQFVVERSTDGKSDWTKIGQVAAVGQSNRPSDYTLIDDAPLALAYYRLQNIDNNGEFEFSNTILIERKEQQTISVYPVPATNQVQLNYHSTTAETTHITITDLMGRVVLQNSLNTIEGFNTETIEISQFATGVYFITLNNPHLKMTTKIVKE